MGPWEKGQTWLRRKEVRTGEADPPPPITGGRERRAAVVLAIAVTEWIASVWRGVSWAVPGVSLIGNSFP